MSTTSPAAAPTAPVAQETLLDGLTVVLPCYDEAANVLDAIAEAQEAARRCARRFEVVVVDDGSRDGTGRLARAAAATDSSIRVVAHERNRGYGAAVRSGITASRMPWVLLTDGDLQFDLMQLVDLLPLAEDHDLIAGYRIRRADPLHRRLAAAAWNRLVHANFGVGVRDVDCAFKLMRGDAVRALTLESEGAMVSTELVVRGQLAGWRVAEAGVNHRPRRAGQSTGGDPRVILRAFRERRAFARELRGREAGEAAAQVAVPGAAGM